LGTLSEICGYGAKAGYTWRKPAKGRDAGDLPSARIMRQMLLHCRKHKIALQPEWLIFGAPEADVTAALNTINPMIAFARREQAARTCIEAAE